MSLSFIRCSHQDVTFPAEPSVVRAGMTAPTDEEVIHLTTESYDNDVPSTGDVPRLGTSPILGACRQTDSAGRLATSAALGAVTSAAATVGSASSRALVQTCTRQWKVIKLRGGVWWSSVACSALYS
jgi:hypothetical protein